MSLVVSQAVDSPLTRAAIFLVVTLKPGGRNTVLGLCADLSSLLRGVGFRDPSGALSCVLGFGASAWDPCLPRRARPACTHFARSGASTTRRPRRATCCFTCAPRGSTCA